MVAVHLMGVLWDLFDFYICLRVDLIDLQNFITMEMLGSACGLYPMMR